MAEIQDESVNPSQNVTISDEKAENKLLTSKEKIFANEYLISLNKTKAAIASGASQASARSRGYEIYQRPHVKKYIAESLKERILSIEETMKLIGDTAQASVTDYFKPATVVKTPNVKVGLADLIASRREYIRREREFADRKGLTDEAYDDFMKKLDTVKDEILRYEIELEMNPLACRIIEGPSELIEVMQLDLNALVADKERGKVKKLKYKDDGSLEIEMYPADAAQDKLMKYHGAYAPIKVANTDKDGNDVPATPSKIVVISGASGLPILEDE